MGQQSSVFSLLKKGLACQKISGTRNHECGKSQPSKMLLPSMHLKLGLMKIFVKAMNQEEAAFTYLRKVPQTKWGKTERRYFNWSTNASTWSYQGRILRQAPSRRRKGDWGSFKIVVKGFWGNRRAENNLELVSNLLQSYQKLGCNMSLKLHFLHSHLDFSQRIVVQWMMNTENVSIKTFLQWKRDIKGNGTGLCSPTTAGLWQVMSLPWNTSDRQNGKKHDFVCVK